jgi:hypothetical protein
VGPTATDALAALIQQLTGGAGTQGGASGGQSAQSNPLLAALQNSTGSGADLTGVFIQLFQGFPNGSGLDVQA